MSSNLIKLAIAAVVAMLLGATAGYVLGVSFPLVTASTTTSTTTSTTIVGLTSFFFDVGCSGCLQAGSEPPIPFSVISVDGVPISEASALRFEFVVGSTQIILASNYTGTCVGIPCAGQSIPVHFNSWIECIRNDSSVWWSTCSGLGTADAHTNPLIITVPNVGENGTVSISGDYAPG